MGGALQKLMDARVDARFAGNYQRLTDKDLPQIWAMWKSSEIRLQYLGRIGRAGVWQHRTQETPLIRLKIHSSFKFKAFQSNISKSRVSSQKIGM